MVDRISGTNYTWLDGPMTKRGWIAKNKVAGIAGTQFTPAFMNGVQEEIISLIESAGIVPSDADWTQLAKALQVMQMSWAGTATGTAAAMIATLSPAPPALKDGMTIKVKAAYACAGATTLWLNGLGAAGVAIAYRNGNAMQTGEWAANDNLLLQYNATLNKWVLQNAALTSAPVGPYSGADTSGSANIITATITSPAITALEVNRTYYVTLANSITGATVANLLAGVGNKPVVRADGSPLQQGDGFGGEVLPLTWTGTQFQVLGLGAGSGAFVGIYYSTTAGAIAPVTPAGAYRAEVEVWGGGGMTQQSQSGAAIAGAGAGGYAKKYAYATTPGATIPGNIGAGTPSGVFAVGGTTTCAGMTAYGGGYGTFSAIGVGGLATGGDINLQGETGTPFSSTGGSGGKGGSAPYGGQGGSTSNSGASVFAGSTPGGGAGGPSGTGTYAGAAGANGGVRIIYYRS